MSMSMEIFIIRYLHLRIAKLTLCGKEDDISFSYLLDVIDF